VTEDSETECLDRAAGQCRQEEVGKIANEGQPRAWNEDGSAAMLESSQSREDKDHE